MMEALNLSAHPWESFGGLILVKSTLLLGLVFLASFVLRRASASTQHYLWTIAFVALLTLPLVSYLSVASPTWRIGIPVLDSAGPAAPALDEAPPARPSTRETSSPQAEGGAATKESGSAWLTWPLLWSVGVAVFLLRLAAGIWESRRARRLAHQLEDEQWLDLLGDAQARIGTLQNVELRQTSAAELPMTIGVLKPSILLPNASQTYPMQRRWAVLLHELAHVRRQDCLTQLVCQSACAIFWWHPLAWLGARKMRALSERASDDLVLDAGAKPSEYAHDLLDMARGLHLRGQAAPIASVTMAHRSRLEERLLAILDPAVARRAIPIRLAIPATLISAGILGSVALAMPTAPVAMSIEPSMPALQVQTGDSPEKDDDDEDQTQPLSEAQQKARAALAGALDDPSPSVRKEALDALVRLRDERTVPYLLNALENGDAQARADAAWGLGQMRRREAVSELIGALSDENDNVREQTAWSLGMLRSADAVDALGTTVMTDSSADARGQAAWALGMIRSADAVDALVAAILDENADVRSQSAWALGMIRDPRSLDGLAKALQDRDEDVREQAIWAVGMLRSPESLDVLVSSLSDSSADIRSEAAWALGRLGDPRAVDVLSVALRDDDADVREQAAWALGQLSRDSRGDDDVDLEMDMDMDMDDEPDNINPSPSDDVNPNPNPPGSGFGDAL